MPSSYELGQQLRREVYEPRNGAPDIERMRHLIRDGADLNSHDSGSYGDIDARTALFLAVDSGYHDAVALLLDAGARLDIQLYGQTPFYIAAARGDTKMVTLLVTKGSGLEAKDYGDALMQACLYGHAETARYLLACGADPLYKNERGQTPYGQCRYKYPETATLLKECSREARMNRNPGLKDRIFQRIAKRATQSSAAAPVKKFKPK